MATTDLVVSQQAVAQTYADLCANILNKPCFAGPSGQAWQQIMGAAMDGEVDRLYAAVQSRFPNYAPSDALYYIANERGLERVLQIGTSGTLEVEAVHRLRLQHVWMIWGTSGSQQQVVDEMGWMGLGSVKVLRRVDFSTPPPVGTPYVRAFAKLVWSQYDVLVNKPMPVAPLIWGSGWLYGQGSTWGSSLLLPEIQQMRRLVREHKSAHDTCTYAYFNFEGVALFGSFRWGDGTVYASGTGQGVTAIVIGEDHWALRGLGP